MRIKKSFFTLPWLLIIAMPLLIGLRAFGYDRDYLEYERMYQTDYYLLLQNRYDQLFIELINLCNSFGLSFESFILICGILTVTPKLLILSKHQYRSIYAFLVYFATSYIIHDGTQIRLAFSLALAFIAIYLLESDGRKYLLAIPLMIAAYYFHKQSIVISLLLFSTYVIFKSIKFLDKKWIMLFSLSSATIIVFIIYFYSSELAQFLDAGNSNYYSASLFYDGNPIRSILNSNLLFSVITACLFIPVILDKAGKNTQFVYPFVLLTFGILVYYILGAFIIAAFRLSEAAIVFQLFLIKPILDYWKKSIVCLFYKLVIIGYVIYIFYTYYEDTPPFLRFTL
jgi:hypothetical protein